MKLEEIKQLIRKNYPLLDYENLTDKWFYIMDRERRVLYANSVARDYIFSGKDPINRDIFELLPYINDRFSLSAQVLKTGIAYKDIVEGYYDDDMRPHFAIVSQYPIRCEDRVVGIYEIGEEISETLCLQDKDPMMQAESQKNLVQNYEIAKGQDLYYTTDDIIGSSQAVKRLKAQIAQAAACNANLFIYGETGTGKELIAQSVYTMSCDYRRHPFIVQNCAAIPEALLESIFFGTEKGAFTGAETRAGLFESAHNGVMYLDEINSMPLLLQGKLLRVLEENKVVRVGGAKEIGTNFRLISSSNASPAKLLKEGSIRSDLYYRLNVLYIGVPPLRHRKEDIPLLVHYFIDKFNGIHYKRIRGVTNKTMEQFMQYDWPGNIRELRNVMERAVNSAVSEIVDLTWDDICGDVQYGDMEPREGETVNGADKVETSSERKCVVKNGRGVDVGRSTLKEEMALFEKKLIREALERNDGNVSSAARELGLPQPTLYGKLQRLELVGFARELAFNRKKY